MYTFSCGSQWLEVRQDAVKLVIGKIQALHITIRDAPAYEILFFLACIGPYFLVLGRE
jgi:hypothetical protein